MNLNRHERHRKRLHEGVLRLIWCPECECWHYHLAWMKQEGWNKAPAVIGQRYAGVIPNDEWSDRNLTRLVREAAHEARMFAEEESAGVIRLPGT
jgi:hypothetical protein